MFVLTILYIILAIAIICYSCVITYYLYHHGKLPGPPSKFKIAGNSTVAMTTPGNETFFHFIIHN